MAEIPLEELYRRIPARLKNGDPGFHEALAEASAAIRAETAPPPEPAKPSPAPAPRAAPRPFEPTSDVGKRMTAEDPTIADFLRRAPSRDEALAWFDAVTDTIKDLRDRVAEFEKSGVRFRGIWQRANAYRLGDQVTHRGSLWAALQAAPEGTVPGEAPEHWQLCVKNLA